MEFYRADLDEWEAGPDLEEARIGVAVAAYMGMLFAAGGFLETDNEQLVRDTVEVYDNKTRRLVSEQRTRFTTPAIFNLCTCNTQHHDQDRSHALR